MDRKALIQGGPTSNDHSYSEEVLTGEIEFIADLVVSAPASFEGLLSLSCPLE